MAEKAITWYNRLKEAINGQIKKNGKREITGARLNSVLNQMVDALGKNMTFGGVVSPATLIDNTDDNPVFYLALVAGNYPYCGNIVVGQGQIAFLFRDANNIWHQASWNAPDENFTTEEKEKLQGLPTEEQLREAFGAKANAPESKPGSDNLASFDKDGNLKDSGVSIPVPTEEEKEHVLSSGETGLKWVPKPADGDDAYGVYVKEYKEGHGGSTDGMLTRQQWLLSLKGDKGDAGNDGHNPNLGTYKLVSGDITPTPPTPTEDGDYIVVIDDSDPTDVTSEIYKYNGSAWQTTGRDANQAYFGSREPLIDTYIDDTELENPREGSLAQAPDVMDNYGYRILSGEYIRVIVDSDFHFLAGIAADGSIEWSKGVPTPIKEYVSQQLESIDLSLDNKVDKVSGKTLIDSQLVEESSNDDYIWVVTDTDSRILLKIDKEGNIDWSKGVPTPIREYVEQKIEGNGGNSDFSLLKPTISGIALNMPPIECDENGWELPAVEGQKQALEIAKEFLNIKVYYKKTVYGTKGTEFPNQSVGYSLGIPYSAVGDRQVGFCVSVETFMTAVNNIYSLLYTEETSSLKNQHKSAWGFDYSGGSEVGRMYYGTVCSHFGNYVTGSRLWLGTNMQKKWMMGETMQLVWLGNPNIRVDVDTNTVVADIDNLRLGDLIVYVNRTTNSGHCVVLTRIRRDADNRITEIRTTEALPGGYSRVYSKTYNSRDKFIGYIGGSGDGIDAQEGGFGYLVRNAEISNAVYKPSPMRIWQQQHTNTVYVYYQLVNNQGNYTYDGPLDSNPASTGYEYNSSNTVLLIPEHPTGESQPYLRKAIDKYPYNNDICTFAGDKAVFVMNNGSVGQGLVVLNFNLLDNADFWDNWDGIRLYKYSSAIRKAYSYYELVENDEAEHGYSYVFVDYNDPSPDDYVWDSNNTPATVQQNPTYSSPAYIRISRGILEPVPDETHVDYEYANFNLVNTNNYSGTIHQDVAGHVLVLPRDLEPGSYRACMYNSTEESDPTYFEIIGMSDINIEQDGDILNVSFQRNNVDEVIRVYVNNMSGNTICFYDLTLDDNTSNSCSFNYRNLNKLQYDNSLQDKATINCKVWFVAKNRFGCKYVYSDEFTINIV